MRSFAAHAFSRFCAVLFSFAGRYVGSAERSRAAPVVTQVKRSDVLVAAVFGLPALVLCGRDAIVAVVVALVLLGLLFRWCVERIGGYTGDTLGAAQQITEIGFYVALLASTGSRGISAANVRLKPDPLPLTAKVLRLILAARDKFPLWDSKGTRV